MPQHEHTIDEQAQHPGDVVSAFSHDGRNLLTAQELIRNEEANPKEQQIGHMILQRALDAPDLKTSNALVSVLSDKYGYENELLRKSIRWTKEHPSSAALACLIGQYRLAHYVMYESKDMQSGDLLRRSTCRGVSLSPQRIADYEIEPVQCLAKRVIGWVPESLTALKVDTQTGYREMYMTHLDAPTGLLLRYKGRPQAVGGFVMNGPSELMITQIQGIIGSVVTSGGTILRRISSRGLAPLNLPALVINMATEIGKGIGSASIAIQGAANNYITTKVHYGEHEPHMQLDQAERIYDEPAAQFGFTKQADGNWHKTLNRAL
jgi:hypothetical protein